MTGFTKQHYDVDGTRVEVLEAGTGRPLVFFHPAGTSGGFDALLPLAKDRRLIIPMHPGFGGSDDDETIDSALDYVVHYKGLFKLMGLDGPLDILGHSLGGWIGSLFAVFCTSQVRRLALACPVGLKVPEHPTVDLFVVPQADMAGMMFANPPASNNPTSGPVYVEQYLTRYREMTSLARFSWHRNYEPKLARWLGQITVPALLVWGEQDRIIPVQQADVWKDNLGGPVTVRTFPGAGHQIFIEAPAALDAIRLFFA